MGTLSCGLWDLVPWPGIKLQASTLGEWSLSHWTTREVSSRFKMSCPLSVRPPFFGPMGQKPLVEFLWIHPSSLKCLFHFLDLSQMLFSSPPLVAAVLTSCPDCCNGLEMDPPTHLLASYWLALTHLLCCSHGCLSRRHHQSQAPLVKLGGTSFLLPLGWHLRP